MNYENHNSSKEYEKLVQKIYQSINNQKHGVNNIKVEHNVNIEGASGCKHQIDVYWEFEKDHKKYKVAIECKNYNEKNPIEIGKIRDFYSVLYDIGNIQGVFITKSRYQQGAKKFAKYYGILTKIVRFPNDEDWTGRIKNVEIKGDIYRLEFKKVDFVFDKDWIINNTHLNKGDMLKLSYDSKTLIEDKTQNKTIPLGELLAQLSNNLPVGLKEDINMRKDYNLDDVYILNNNERFKIKSLSLFYDVVKDEDNIIFNVESLVKAILKDVETEDTKFYFKNGNVN